MFLSVKHFTGSQGNNFPFWQLIALITFNLKVCELYALDTVQGSASLYGNFHSAVGKGKPIG